MATHSSTLAWKIPWTEESGRLQSMGSLGVRHSWEASLSLFTFMHWRRKWQPTPVFLPGESQGRGSLVGCHLWGRTELDTTEATEQQVINLSRFEGKKKQPDDIFIGIMINLKRTGDFITLSGRDCNCFFVPYFVYQWFFPLFQERACCCCCCCC